MLRRRREQRFGMPEPNWMAKVCLEDRRGLAQMGFTAQLPSLRAARVSPVRGCA